MSIERTIVQRLFESRKLSEASFEANGSTYKCVFGRYYKDDEPISRDDYFAAKDSQGGNNSDTPKSEDSKKEEPKKSSIKDFQMSYPSGGAVNMNYLDIHSEDDNKIVFRNYMYTHKSDRYLTADKSTGVVKNADGEVYGRLRVKK